MNDTSPTTQKGENDSSPYSQKLATGSYSDPDEASTSSPILQASNRK